jgi:hypothetical protein
MDDYFPHIFVSNIFLTFIDATIGYHVAPTLARLGGNDEESTQSTIRGVRKLLAAVVALYMFFNCLAFFDHTLSMLLVVTGIIVLDIAAQLMVSVKMRNRKQE